MSDESDRRLQPARGQDLVVPIYLDIPSTVSLVAALEGGVAFTRRSTSASHDTSSAEGGAKGAASIPLISSLLRLEVSGDLRGKQEQVADQAVEIERQHTAASLFNLLLAKLSELQLLRDLRSPADLEDVVPGDLITMSGRILSDPVLALAEALAELSMTLKDVMQVGPVAALLEALVKAGIAGSTAASDPRSAANTQMLVDAIFGTSSAAPQPALTATGAGQKRRQNQAPRTSTTAVTPSAGRASTELVDQASALLMKVRDGLRASPVSDLLITGEGIRGVVPVTRGFLEPQSSELMKGSDLTALGKVTRVLRAKDDQIDLLRRSIVGYVAPATADRAYAYLRDRRFLNLDLAELVVEAPAVQVLPLALYI